MNWGTNDACHSIASSFIGVSELCVRVLFASQLSGTLLSLNDAINWSDPTGAAPLLQRIA